MSKRLSIAALALAALACNSVFGLDEVSVREDAGGGVGGATGGTAGSGGTGAATGGVAGSVTGGTAGSVAGGTGGTAGSATGGTGGTGGTVQVELLIDVSGTHACAARNGVLKCWGDNAKGQLDGTPSTNAIGDVPGEMGSKLVPVDLGGASVAGLALGYFHTCVLTKSGTVRCWGSQDKGQLGFGSKTVDVSLGGGAQVKQLDAGGFYNCALLASGAVKCWGSNTNKQLGQDHQNDLGDDGGEMGDALPALGFGAGTTVTEVVTGYDFACTRLADGSKSPSVRCWGSNDEGQLGFGPLAANVALVSSTSILAAKPLLALAAGRTHACVINADESVSCWGVNYYGELGLGVNDANKSTPSPVLLGDYKAKALALGTNHTCAIVEKTGEARSIKCWGHNNKGQRGVNSLQSVGQTPSGMGNALSSVILPVTFVPKRIAASEDTTCALSEAGQVLCWGNNPAGLLGQGRTDPNIGSTANSMQSLVPIDLGWPG